MRRWSVLLSRTRVRSKTFRGCTLALLMCVAAGHVTAQHYPVIHYGSAQGLTDVNIYDLSNGPDGQLWMATERGITAFNGLEFKAYREDSHGRFMGAAIRLFTDSLQRVWIGTHKNGVFRYEQGQIAHTGIDLPTTKGLLFAKNNFYLVATPFVYVVNDGKIKTLGEDEHPWIQVYPSTRHHALLLRQYALYELLPGGETIRLYESAKDDRLHSCWETKNGDLLIGSTGKIFLFRQGLVVQTIHLDAPIRVSHLMQDRQGRIWFTDNARGVYVWSNGHLMDIGKQLNLSRTDVSCILEDPQANIWIATLGKGLFRFHHTYIQNHDRLSGYDGGAIFRITKRPQGGHYLGSYTELYMLENTGLEVITPEGWYHFKDIQVDEEGRVQLSAQENPNNLSASRSYKKDGTTLFPSLSYTMAPGNGDTVFTGFYSDWINVNRNAAGKLEYLRSIVLGEDAINRTNHLVFLKDEIWQATTKGLRIISGEGRVKQSWLRDISGFSVRKSSPLAADVRHVYAISDTEVWVLAETGVFRMLQKGGRWEEERMCCNTLSDLSDITWDNKGRLWVGSSGGLYCFQNNEQRFHFAQHNGLVTDHVTSLVYDEDLNRLLVGTSEGLSMIDIAGWEQMTEVPPVIRLKHIESNGGGLPNRDVFRIGDRDFLKVTIAAANLGETGPLLFRYELDGREVGFNRENSLVLSSLTDGAHELRVSAKTENSIWSEPVFIDFHVVTPWYRSPLFLMSLSLALVISVLLTLLWWQRRTHRQWIKDMRVRGEINRLKLQSLLVMMRPHFISNIISAVRHSLRENNRLPVDMAMSRLSRLMRVNLQMVQTEQITIVDEVAWLVTYIELERYVNQAHWTFEVSVDEELQSRPYSISPMLIQPFVENAIIHGLAGESGLLVISFVKEDEYCKVSVTDNGPGFSKTIQSEKKEEEHVSNGIRIIRERLDILHKLTGKVHRCEMEDGRLLGMDFGTRIWLWLPLYEPEVTEPF